VVTLLHAALFLCRLLGVDDSRPTPAHRLADGRDYVPSRTHVVFAHHFAVIAGAGPIVGPTLALAFGYGASWAWIVVGCVLFGAVHDMTSMFVSMREDGRSIAEMANRTLGKSGYLLLVAFLVLILTLVNAIFLNLSCKALTADYPLAAASVLMLLLASGVIVIAVRHAARDLRRARAAAAPVAVEEKAG
jgi:carbon starvation protein